MVKRKWFYRAGKCGARGVSFPSQVAGSAKSKTQGRGIPRFSTRCVSSGRQRTTCSGITAAGERIHWLSEDAAQLAGRAPGTVPSALYPEPRVSGLARATCGRSVIPAGVLFWFNCLLQPAGKESGRLCLGLGRLML